MWIMFAHAVTDALTVLQFAPNVVKNAKTALKIRYVLTAASVLTAAAGMDSSAWSAESAPIALGWYAPAVMDAPTALQFVPNAVRNAQPA